jgi:hypothetical protein
VDGSLLLMLIIMTDMINVIVIVKAVLNDPKMYQNLFKN